MPKTTDRLRAQVGKISPVLNEVRKRSLQAEDMLTKIEQREARERLRMPKVGDEISPVQQELNRRMGAS